MVSASFAARAGAATAAIGGAASSTTYPLDGATIAYVSNGDATAGFSGTQASIVSHDLGTTARGGYDVTILSLRVAVPEDANCLTVGATFFSEDYGEATTDDARYFDSLLAELDPQDAWAAGAGDPSSNVAPANFAFVAMPDGLQPVSVDVGSRTLSAAVQPDGTWSVSPSLEPGTYTARASQADTAGNEGLSAPRTFTIGRAPSPTPTPTPTPTSSPTTTPSPQPTTTPSPEPTTEEGTDPALAGEPQHGTQPSAAPVGGFATATPAPTCRVPKLHCKRITAVSRALRRAGCRIGRITRKRARKGRRGRVVAQVPRAGARRPGGTRVKVTLRR